MSENVNIPQDQEAEEEPAADAPQAADPSDTQASEGDPPIIVQGGGSGTSG